jgi:hypothetical protein
MYCPQCSQQQPDAAYYCSRCGLSIYEISVWLTGNRVLTNADVMKQLSPRRKWILRAAKVTFFSGVLLPIGFLLAAASREPVFILVPLIVFFASLVWMLYCRLFVEDTNAVAIQASQRSIIAPVQYVPPVQVGSPIALEGHRINTAEMGQPPSVTEYTTNLLKKDRR